MIALALALALVMGPQECAYDERCGNGMCLVWEGGRNVCEPKQYTVAVYDYEDIETVVAKPGAKVVCPVLNAEPDRAHCRLEGAIITFKPNHTYHFVVRNRGEQ